MEKILDKIFEKYENFNMISHVKFQELMGDEINEIDEGIRAEIYMDWFIFDNEFPGELNFLDFVKKEIDLDDDEKQLIEFLDNAVIGYFEILKWEDNIILIKDFETKKEYQIPNKGYLNPDHNIIETKFIKDFDGEYTFISPLYTFDEEDEEKIRTSF